MQEKKEDNMKKIRNVLLAIFFANIIVAAIKLIIGTIINSGSLTADGFHSLSDASSNIVGIIGIMIASKPEDEDHPYGHKKIETITGMFIGFMLLSVGFKVIYGAFKSFLHPTVPAVSVESIIAMVITVLINIFVSTYEHKAGQKLNSHILISDSLHTRSDIFVSIGVLITLLGIKLGLPPIIDPLASLVVSGFILHAAYEVFSDTIGVLVDKAVVDQEVVKKICFSFAEIKDVHNIRSRGREDDIFIDMHIKIDSDMNVEETHRLVLALSDKIKECLGKDAQVITHIEPYTCNEKTT